MHCSALSNFFWENIIEQNSVTHNYDKQPKKKRKNKLNQSKKSQQNTLSRILD